MKIGLTNITNCKIGSTQVNRVYIGSNLIWNYASVDPDAQLFITNAGITDTTQQSAINTLVVSLKGNNIWTKMKAIYPFVGGTAAQHKFNLKNPLDTNAAFRIAFNGGWTHSNNGVQGNGINNWMNTWFNAPTQFASNLSSAHFSIYSRTDTLPNTFDIYISNTDYAEVFLGINTFDPDVEIFGNIGGPNYIAASLTPPNAQGLFTISRISNSSQSIYKNQLNVSLDTAPLISNFYNDLITIGGADSVGAYSSNEYAFASIGTGLTNSEVANYYTAVETFQTTLGRNVSVPIVSDPDAQAFLNAALISNVTQASAVNTLVTDLKGYGIWTKIKALYPFVGGTASKHKWNLKNPLDMEAAFRLVFIGGVTHSANGVKGNEVNGWYQTFINPSTVFSPTSGGSLFIYSRDDLNTGADLGAFAFSPTLSRFYFTSRVGFSFEAGGLSNGYVNTPNFDSRGFFGITREPNAPNYYCVLNTNSVSTTDAYQEPNSTIKGLGIIADNNQALSWSARQQAMACIADGLTLAEAQNLRLANLTFQTTLGRNV